jgi:hypothetical protein
MGSKCRCTLPTATSMTSMWSNFDVCLHVTGVSRRGQGGGKFAGQNRVFFACGLPQPGILQGLGACCSLMWHSLFET